MVVIAAALTGAGLGLLGGKGRKQEDDAAGAESLQSRQVPVSHALVSEQTPRPALDDILAATGWQLFRSLGAFLPDATTDELAVLAEAWAYRVEKPRYPDLVWKLLLARWVELDPHEALSIEGRVNHYTVRGFCYETWIHLDYPAALASALGEEEPPYHRIISEVMKRDPQLGLTFLEKAPGLQRSLIEAWAIVDTDAAIAAMENCPPDMRSAALGYLIEALAASDKERALQLVDLMDSTERRHRATVEVVKEWLQQDAAAAGAYINRLSNGKTRSELFTEWVKLKAQDDPESTWEWARNLPLGNDRHLAIGLAAERLAGSDPEKLLALFEEVGWEYATYPLDKVSLVRYPGGGWQGTGSDGRMSRAVDLAIQSLAKEDPRAALEKLAQFPRVGSLHGRGDGWSGMIHVIAGEWFGRSPEEAMAWALTIPNPDRADPLARNMFRGSSDDNLEAAQRYLTSSPPGPATPYLGRRLISALAQDDPMGALNLTAQLDSIDALTNQRAYDVGADAYEDIARSWVRKDSLAMSEWAGGLAVGPRKDAVVNELVGYLMSGDAPDFEAAFQWAQQLSHGPRSGRDHRLEHAWSEWRRREPQVAEEALAVAEVSPELRQKLLAPPES